MSKVTLFYLIPLVLVFLITIIAVAHKHGARQATNNRRQREPRMRGDKLTADYESEENTLDQQDAVEYVGPVRVRSRPTSTNKEIIGDEESILALAETEAKPITTRTPIKSDLTIVIGLQAEPDRPYVGYELLQALLTAGLRYGKMNIFHRHEEANGRGSVLFSLASALEPGTFDLPKMGAFSAPALVLFMRSADLADPLKAFEIMLSTGQQLIDDLGGILCDQTRQPLEEEKVNEWRAQLQPAGETE